MNHSDINQRGLDFYNPDRDPNPSITIVGVGGVGSWAALVLAKLGFNRLVLYDHDKVELQNLGCQLYGADELDEAKVYALQELLWNQTGAKIQANQRKFAGAPSGVVVTAVDSMKDRRTIFSSCKDANLFVDCRIGGEKLVMYAVDPSNETAHSEYLKNWYPDEEAADLPCTGQQTAYIGAIAGGLIGREVADYCHNGGYSYSETIMDISTLQIVREETKL